MLDAADVWCAPVLTLEELVAHDGFASIDMVQQVERDASLTRSKDGRAKGAQIAGASRTASR